MVSFAVLFVADLFHPVHGLAFELFLARDVGHSCGWCSAMPVFFADREPHDIPRPDFFDGTSPALNPTEPGGDDERLAERVGVPGCSSTGFERNDCARDPRRLGSLEG